MLGLTMTPKSPSAMAILSVVRRDHLRPVMGSPAVSYSSRNSISVTMSAVFFQSVCVRRRRGACGPSIHSIQQLLASARDGVGIQAEEFGQNAIASVSQFDGLQPGEQAALLLIEQAVEKQNSRFEFIGRYL